MKVEQLMTRQVVTVSPNTPLKDIAELLLRNRISGVPVCDAEGSVVGVVSEGDLLWKELGRSTALPGLVGRIVDLAYGDSQRVAAVSVENAMTSPAITVAPSAPVAKAAELMIEYGVNRLPVVEDGKLVGIVTRADLVRVFNRTDEEVRREIVDDVLVHLLWVDPADVGVTVADGAVELAGKVENRTTAEVLEACVRRVPGVVSVEAKLRWLADDRARRAVAP